MEAFLGTISIFGFNFSPRGWVTCNGQMMAIQQNTALFSLLGTQFGGDGRVTFGLPNLQGNAAIGQGTNAGSSYVVGQIGGSETITATLSNLPAHTHPVTMSINANVNGRVPSSSTSPVGAYPSIAEKDVKPFNSAAGTSFLKTPTVALAASGGTSPMNISDPTSVMNYCICTSGIFPARN